MSKGWTRTNEIKRDLTYGNSVFIFQEQGATEALDVCCNNVK